MTAIDLLTRKLMDLGASTEIVVLVVEAVTAVTRDSHKASQMSRVTVTHVTPDDVRKAACLRKRKQREREKQQRLAAKEAEANDAAAAAVTVTNVTRDKCDRSQNTPTYLLTSSSQTLNKQKSLEEGSKHRKKDSSEKARATRIPADWQIEQRHIDYAISKGIAPDRIPALGEKFKNHWLAASGKGAVSPNWFLKWCTWAMNDVEWNGAKNGAKSHQDRTSQASRSGATGQDAILAGMGRLADRVRARGDAERRDREASADDGAAEGPDARLL